MTGSDCKKKRRCLQAGMLGIVWVVALFSPRIVMASDNPVQYILLNRMPGSSWNQNRPDSFQRRDFEEIATALPQVSGARIRVGVGFIFSTLHAKDDQTLADSLRCYLQLAAETDTPVLIQFDDEHWWGAQPDLWNWWDPLKPGFDPTNRENVEWTDWGSQHAIKISWRNWGSQLRVHPAPNLMSPKYRQTCREKLRLLLPIVLEWSESLSANKKDLFVGVKVGHESSIGVNSWYYPNGNDLLDKPTSGDPTTGLNVEEVPSRGVTPIGYAAVQSAGIRHSGQLTEADLAEVVRRHLTERSQIAAECDVPREKLFTHCGGWREDELLKGAALNEFACPGWSFYKYAHDPREDSGAQAALKRSDAPHWAAVEWLFMGPRTEAAWKEALQNTLGDPRCRFLCVFNWESIRNNPPVLKAIQSVIAESLPEKQ